MKNKYSIIILTILLTIVLTTAISADQIELQNGEKIRGEIINSSIKIKNSYAEINIQTQFIKKIEREKVENENLDEEGQKFILRLSENNRFSGNILNDIIVSSNSGERNLSPLDIKTIDFSNNNNNNLNNNKGVSVTTTNGNFFFANTVEDGISIKTSLGSPLNIQYRNIIDIEYLSEEKLYLIRRKNAAEVKANFAQEKIILWPAAGEIFELNLNYLKKLVVN